MCFSYKSTRHPAGRVRRTICFCHVLRFRKIQPVPVSLSPFAGSDLAHIKPLEIVRGTVVSSTGIACGREDDGEQGNNGENGNDGGTQGDSSCANAEEVANVGPTTDNSVTPFETTGRTFRVSYDVTFIEEDAFSSVEIDVEDRFGLVDFEIVERSERDRFIVTEGPGAYELIVNVEPANSARYSVSIEDCAGVNSSNDDEDDIINDPGGNLPNTGGAPLSALMVGAALLLVGGAVVGTVVGRRRR